MTTAVRAGHPGHILKGFVLSGIVGPTGVVVTTAHCGKSSLDRFKDVEDCAVLADMLEDDKRRYDLMNLILET